MINYLTVEDIYTRREGDRGMDYRELTYELMEMMRKKKRPINDFREFEKGENGILQSLLINEKSGGEMLTPGELSAIQEISTGRVAAALKSLENKNYIDRQIDKNDRRRIIVTLTESGRSCAQKLYEETIEKVERVLREIGEKDAREFFRILKRILEIDTEI